MNSFAWDRGCPPRQDGDGVLLPPESQRFVRTLERVLLRLLEMAFERHRTTVLQPLLPDRRKLTLEVSHRKDHMKFGWGKVGNRTFDVLRRAVCEEFV